MKLGFGRVVPASEADERTTEPRGVSVPSAGAARIPRGRVAPADVVNAADAARGLLERAEKSATALLARAEREAAEVRLRALTEARADAAARIAAHALALSFREDRALERNLDRVVEVARVLAELLLGEALSLEPERIVALARRAVEEARGARRVTIVAHPEDAALVEKALSSLNAGAAANVLADPARPRGSLRLDTDI